MKAELIIIGEEILSGQTVDSNSSYIGRKLSEIGVEVVYKIAVGDRVDDIQSAILIAWNRSDVVIATGGLGPTADDITKKAICNAFERKLVFHDDILKAIEDRFKQRNAKMPAIVQNQALQPQGAEFVVNPIGSAPGIVIQDPDHCFIALPGVPSEMQEMIDKGVLTLLKSRIGRRHIEIRRIRSTGITESEIAEAIGDLQPAQDNVRLAYLPNYSGVDLRVTAITTDETESRTLANTLAEAIVGRVGNYIYTIGEQSMPEVVATLLTAKEKTLSTAESCTGGLIAKMLTDIAGSSTYFIGSVVSYSNQAKESTLKVPRDLLERYGAVSAEVAEAMAAGIRQLLNTDYSLAVTGIAGPSGGTPEKPVGLVYLACATDKGVTTKKLNLIGPRQRIRERSATIALDLLRRTLINETK